MTDDLAGSAPAPADTPALVETSIPSNTPEPVTEATPRDAIERAFAKVEADTPAEKPAAQPVDTQAPDTRPRNPDGTFANKDAAPVTEKPADGVVEAPKPVAAGEAPPRFSEDAKTAWKDVPEAVRGEVSRMERELTAGIEKYRGAYQPFHPFVELARQNNVHPIETLQNYVGIDTLLTQDFEAGVRQIFANKGQSLEAFVAKIAGKPVNEQGAQADATINELRNEIRNLKQGFDGISGSVKEQQSAQIGARLDTFLSSMPAEDKTLFEELDAEIAHYLADPSTTVAVAFAKAKRDAEQRYTRMFGPRAQTPAPAAIVTPPATSQPVQTRGSNQITGAPGPGSNPAAKRTPSSAREAIDGAFSSLGL